MYRLCKLFVSEITAGENLLRNGFVPIVRESGRADHGVLFAANGTCKTTLLSFLLNAFCPDQRRFVQHLQSGGDKTLEQYLIPGRPAVVLLDLIAPLQPTLFDTDPAEHLVIGQLLYRHRNAPDRMDRLHFIAQSADLFDRLRGQWDDLLQGEQPYRQVRDFLTPRVQQTTSQKEWAETLERIGLDPWLIDRQIDFARTEGGIKDAFKFRSESEFMDFFLGCVADMEAAATLRETIGHSLRKIEDRPRKIAQLRAARALKERITAFDETARKWRLAGEAVTTRRETLGEAAHLLGEAGERAAAELARVTPLLESAEAQRRDAASSLETTRASALAVQRLQALSAIAEADAGIAAARAQIDTLQGKQRAVTAAGRIALLRKKRSEARIKEAALVRVGAELDPMLRKVAELAAQYHLRLDSDKARIREEMAALHERMAASEAAAAAAEKSRTDAAAEQAELEQKIGRITAEIQAGEARRAALPLQAGETPSDALDRLAAESAEIGARIARIRQQMLRLDEEMQGGNSRWRMQQAERSDMESRLRSAREELEHANQARARLLADPHLIRIAETPAFEPGRAALATRLDDAIARRRLRLEEKQRQRMALESERDQLDRMETLAADSRIHRLIAHYREAGIPANAIRSYPEYLADACASPEEIAVFIEGDPARFTGIMAADPAVIDAVLRVPVPEWLHHPVVISTPCPAEAVTPTGHTVIRPPDSRVYSRRHMEETRAQLQARLADLETEIADDAGAVREMARTSRALHAYRERYPDRMAVASLSRRVAELETGLARVVAELAESENRAETLRDQKAAAERRYRDLTADLTRCAERSGQVTQWLEQYADLGQRRTAQEEMITARSDLAGRIAAETRRLREMRETMGGYRGDVRVLQTRLKELEERAGDVPPSPEADLSPTDRDAAVEMDLRTLRGLYEAAREDQRQAAHTLGIDALEKELTTLQREIAETDAAVATLQREHPFDRKEAETWAGRSAGERQDRGDLLTADIAAQRESAIALKADRGYREREVQRLETALADLAADGIEPEGAPSQPEETDLAALLGRFRRDAARHQERQGRLAARCAELERNLAALSGWHQALQLGMAETRTFPPLWDDRSPRLVWPDLQPDGGGPERRTAVQSLREQVRKITAAEDQERRAVDACRRAMSSAFDRLQADLQGDACRQHLPAIVDALRQHDAESLGGHGPDLMQRCEEIARNIESDLEISRRIVDNLVDMLLQRGREYHQKLQAAARETLPADVFIYGGKPILRAGARLDFTGHAEAFRRSVENWLYELIEQDRLPEVNPRAGNRLGAELLYQLLGAASGKTDFGIRLLKCDDTGRNYEPVGKDLGSGGEALTTAVLLYALLISMRKKRRNQPGDRIPAFLILDNPLGVCNRADFLDAQLKVARAMGIQCVYLTGINDRESLDLFELRVAIRKGERKIDIDNTPYDLLEIAELNLEKARDIS